MLRNRDLSRIGRLVDLLNEVLSLNAQESVNLSTGVSLRPSSMKS